MNEPSVGQQIIYRGVHVVVSAEQDRLLESYQVADPDRAMRLAIYWADEQERQGAPRPQGGWDWNAWVDLWRCLCGEYLWGKEPAPWNCLYQNHDVWVAYVPAPAVRAVFTNLEAVDRHWFAERHRVIPPKQATGW
jgi:hypothetical protein